MAWHQDWRKLEQPIRKRRETLRIDKCVRFIGLSGATYNRTHVSISVVSLALGRSGAVSWAILCRVALRCVVLYGLALYLLYCVVSCGVTFGCVV